ncbi:MAG TPA: protein translocase subunit SecF [Thermoanaerobaculia bacterium]|nr:protein translocase subunit SecF [Thermoanaerobaculia bacterium]
MQIFVNPHYNFVKWRLYWFAFSIVFISIGAVIYFTKGIDLGIDFSGGANIVLKFKDQVPISQLRSQLPDATIQQYGKAEDRSVLIRLPQLHREGDYAGNIVARLHDTMNPGSNKLDINFYGSERLASLFKDRDPDGKGTDVAAQRYYNELAERIIAKRSEVGIFTSQQQVTGVPGMTSRDAAVLNDFTTLGSFNVLNQETVGPQVGKELQQKAFWAVILSAIAMGVYISLRFDLMFGVSAVACIIHDVMTGLAFLLMMRLEFSLNVVAALLTIVGYSINDTVVMYDRVRENRRKMKKQLPLGEELNLAMNQTLSRTILTSGTVFIVLVALVAFGGQVIRGFAWILMIGVLSGTYSTISIVPAVAIWWERLTGKRNARLAAPAPARAEVRETPVPARNRKVS